jgi:predicted NBD/HSP70 family sugar kinase
MVGNCHPLLASAKEAAGRMRKNMTPRTSHKGEKQNHALEKCIAAANRGWMSEKFLPPADQGKCFYLTSPFIEPATGHGGGIIMGGEVIKGRKGFGGELGHVLIPYPLIPGIEGLKPECNCRRMGDLEALCSLTSIRRHLLPHFLLKYPDHELGKIEDVHKAAYRVRGMAEKGDQMCQDIFRVQARALGLFFDQTINTFDPDALIMGGGVVETNPEFQRWFIDEIRVGMGAQRKEQADIPIHVMPNGDTAGARGAALEALKFARAGAF